MGNKKISELSAAGALTGAESVEIVQGGANVRTTTQDIADLGGGGGGGGTWGSITGTLSSQTDLQAALNEKSDAIATIVDGSTNYTLQTSDLTLINAGANVIIEGDGTGTLTIPLNSSVAFPLNCFIGFRGFILVAATGGVTATPTNASLDCDPDFLFALEKTATNTWNVHNGSSVTSTSKPPIQLACSDETTAITSGTAKITFRMPYAMTITEVRASLSTAQSSGSIFTVDINKGGSTILSTKITIDNTEKTSTTAATPAVISDTALTDDAEITIDVDQVGDGTAKGLKVTLIGN